MNQFVPEQGVVTNSPLAGAISDEAVEVAAKTYYTNLGWDWDSLDTEAKEHDESKAVILTEFRAVLEAAAPLVLAAAVHEAYVNAQRAVAAVSAGGAGEYYAGQVAMQEDAVRAIRTAAEEARNG